MQHFGRLNPVALVAIANPLLNASRDCVSFTTAQHHQVPQAGLSVALQSLINAAIERGDITTGDVASAVGTAFATFAAHQGRDRRDAERLLVDLGDAAFRTLPTIAQRRRGN